MINIFLEDQLKVYQWQGLEVFLLCFADIYGGSSAFFNNLTAPLTKN
jgi:hypothetical protein